MAKLKAAKKIQSSKLKLSPASAARIRAKAILVLGGK